jgi:ubiquitin-like protein Pup
VQELTRRRTADKEAVMARDGGQQHKQPKKSSENEEVQEAEVTSADQVAERKEQLDEDIDAILDEIDDVLESNAEDFVKSFIQKGGE